MDRSYPKDLDKILGAMSRAFAEAGNTAAVTLLALSRASIEQTDYDGWNGGTYGYTLTFEADESLYEQLGSRRDALAEAIKRKFHEMTPQYADEAIHYVVIAVELAEDEQWREKAKAWVTGQGVSNQGRVRSDNLAPRMADGLLFRSQPEIHLYRALRATGVSFAPLPVFVRGGQTYRRIEPDFIILKDGIVMAVEVDGDTVHRETPAEAHDRTTMLAHEGAHVERVKASECETPEKARACAARLLSVIEKLKGNR